MESRWWTRPYVYQVLGCLAMDERVVVSRSSTVRERENEERVGQVWNSTVLSFSSPRGYCVKVPYRDLGGEQAWTRTIWTRSPSTVGCGVQVGEFDLCAKDLVASQRPSTGALWEMRLGGYGWCVLTTYLWVCLVEFLKRYKGLKICVKD